MSKIIEQFEYKKCIFNITKDDDTYYARCEEMSTYDTNLKSLKDDKIPNCYHAHRVFKL